jgi:hypothetical protein
LGGLDFVCPNAGAATGKAAIAATKPARSNAKPIAFSLLERRLARRFRSEIGR